MEKSCRISQKILAFFGILWYTLCCRVCGKARKKQTESVT